MAITAADVKALREKTGVGMMECKKALAEADGDMEKAVDILRERGMAVAAKKASRAAAEGLVLAVTEGDATVVVEVNSETDFVGNNEQFRAFVTDVAKTILAKRPADVDALMETEYLDTGKTVNDALQELILVIKENMKVRRFVVIEGKVVTYIHGGGTVAVAVKFDTDADASDPAFIEMGKDVAMQIAAMNPEYLAASDIPAEELAKMKSITIDSALNKPDTLPKPILNKVMARVLEAGVLSAEDQAAYEAEKNNKFLFNFLSKEGIAAIAQVAVSGKEEYVGDMIFTKAIEGRIAKQIKEICLLEQTFVKDDKINVGQYVANCAKAMGKNVAIECFVRYEKGEGIEKRVDDFASEVAGMMK